MIVNDHISGQWRNEIHMDIPDELRNNIIDLTITVDTAGARIAVASAGQIDFHRDTDFFDCDRIAYSESVEFSITDKSENDFHAAPITSNSLLEIVSANRDFVTISADGATLPSDGYLIASVGDYECGRLEIEAVNSTSTELIRIPISNQTPVGNAMTVSVSAQTPDYHQVLAHGTIELRYFGGLDRCSEQLVRGWAFNPNNPDEKVVVDIYLNEVYQGSAIADRTRNDLAALDPRFRSTGFLFKFPKSVYLPESSDTRVSARPANTALELENSPWYICRRVRLADQD